MTPQPDLEPTETPAAPRAAASWLAPRAETQGFPRYIEVIRAGRWIIIACLLVCIGGAVVYLARADNVYEAQTDLLVNPLPDLPVPIPGIIQQSSDPTRDVETAARLVSSPTVAGRVRERLNIDTTTSRLLRKIDVRPVAQSNVVTITASESSPRKAVALADAFGEEFVKDRTERLHTTLDDYIKRL